MHDHSAFSLRRHKTPQTSFGDRVSDRIAAVVGSWNFIIIQSLILFGWIVLNITAWINHWDPYPFILLNLVLSFQAAFTAPIIMMAQNRQAAIDRQRAELDYQVNCKAEVDIEALHAKVDAMRQEDITRLIGLLEKVIDERADKKPD
ncbi:MULTISPECIES: DUF1003 domain-containing protein [Asticcacaulis]|uniref:DUF1003 domain-containing protein n=1 Tax=Asticcacaulis TaxID=76890 RepID=UPI001AE1C00B|nr:MULTISPECIES: DUF1003 domain-containing protein [Asticcacaulis]MBP2161404.1 putative membrane protein [Asticcacaulis solisilvae]MDR6802449.1 putative membrane protein [Asticcacaulis sp. BE141]